MKTWWRGRRGSEIDRSLSMRSSRFLYGFKRGRRRREQSWRERGKKRWESLWMTRHPLLNSRMTLLGCSSLSDWRFLSYLIPSHLQQYLAYFWMGWSDISWPWASYLDICFKKPGTAVVGPGFGSATLNTLEMSIDRKVNQPSKMCWPNSELQKLYWVRCFSFRTRSDEFAWDERTSERLKNADMYDDQLTIEWILLLVISIKTRLIRDITRAFTTWARFNIDNSTVSCC